MTYEDFRG